MTAAQSAYAAKHSAIMAHLAEIHDNMQDRPYPETASLTWADVGDLSRIEKDLEAIVEYLA
jgi:hypothetical protein